MDPLAMASTHTVNPEGIVAFVFTDLEGSTRSWEVDAPAMRVDVARHLALVDEVSARHGGRRAPEQGAGDSTVTAYARASDALLAAVELQQSMHATTWAGAQPLRLRIGVHAGEVDLDAHGAYAGPTMNRCGRLLQAAHGGQILASSTAVDLAQVSLTAGVTLDDLGPHHLRGIAEPVRIVQVTPAGMPSSFPPPRTVDGAAASLPVPDSTFVGRGDDIVAVAARLERHRVVTIVGAGGCGKTRLAIEVAHEVLGRFEDGAVWIDLAPVTSAEAVVDALAVGLGLRTSVPLTPERVVAHLVGRSVLVVVDNCEHVIAAAADLVSAIETTAPDTTVLVTSREPLSLKDEVVWRVPSLGVPVDAAGRDLLDSDAGRLLVERVARVRPAHASGSAEDIGPEELRALARICRRLDGIPLALELAAARTAAIPPLELADRLDERFSALGGGGRDVIARQRTLEASIAWSHQLLDPEEQRAFRRLSAFSGSFPLTAAVELVGGDPSQAEATVLRLWQCSLLVERTGPTGAPAGHARRFQLLEAVRWFARERLVEHDEADAVLAAHLAWCVETARALGRRLEGPEVRAAMGRLDQELDNLRAAMVWAIEHGHAADAARIVTATPWYWLWRGRILEAGRWLDRALDASPELSQPDLLELHWARAELSVNAADPSAFSDAIDRALVLAHSLGDARAEARLRVSYSRHLAFADPVAALEHAAGDRERCRQCGERFWGAISLVSESLAQISLGRFDLAEGVLDELHVVACELGHPQLLADELARRVIVDRRLGRYDSVRRAKTAIDELTEGFTELNSRALVHAAVAFVDVGQGRAEHALDAMEVLFRQYVVAGEYTYLPSFALPMMEALIDLGRPVEALERFEAVWRSCAPLLSWQLRMGGLRAVAQLAAGDRDAARAGLLDVLAVAVEAPNEHEAAVAERYLAAIERDEQQFASAEARLHRALEVQVALGYPQYAADVLEELGGLELVHDRPRAAAVLMGAASKVRDDAGVVRRIGRQQAYEADVAALGQLLGTDELSASWSQGAALSLGEAAELARRGRGERGRPSTGWESLTATETKVALLVAEGCTNPEIAERLVMGRATVKTHVSSILRKLGVANRTQVAGAVLRRDLEDRS